LEDLNQLIADNLKEIRRSKALSLEQTSSLTSISKSMLSQLERGEVNPTISTVYKLSLGLKVPVTAFTAPKPTPFSQTSKAEVSPLVSDDGRYRLYPVFSFRDREYVLEAGDSAAYNAFDDYIYKNTGKGMITACIVVHYPN